MHVLVFKMTNSQIFLIFVIMASTTNTTPVSAAPANGQQPIQSGSQTIQRPTANTSTESTLKEGKI
jgi:hypothetical protein